MHNNNRTDVVPEANKFLRVLHVKVQDGVDLGLDLGKRVEFPGGAVPLWALLQAAKKKKRTKRVEVRAQRSSAWD